MRFVPFRVSCLGPVRRLACVRGGGGGPVPPVPGLESCAPLRAGLCLRGGPAPGGVGGWGGGGLPVCLPPPEAWPGGPQGRGVALLRSVPLPSLGGHQSGCHRRCSVHGGRGLHTAPVRVRVLTQGVGRGAPLCAGTGPPACRGHCGSRCVAALGRVAHRSSCVPPPGAAALLRGGGLPWPRRGVEGPRPLGPSQASHGPEGGELGGEGGGLSRGSSPPYFCSLARTPDSNGWVACSPRPRPPLMAGAVAARISPCRVLGRSCLAAPGAGRGLAGRWWVSLVGGGGGLCAAPCRGLGRGAPGGRGRAVALPRSISPFPPAGHQGGPLRRCTAPHTAPARVRVPPPGCGQGCPCAPAQGCWPAAATVGLGGPLTGGMRRTAACTVAVAPLPGCRGPLGGRGGFSLWPGGGDAGPPSPWPASGCPWAGRGRGGRGRRGGAPRCPPPVPRC